MRRVLRSGDRAFELQEWCEGAQGTNFLEFYDKFSVISFLRSFQNDHFNMASLRDILASGASAPNVFRFTDQEVIELVASQILDGRFRVCPLSDAPYAGIRRFPERAVPEEPWEEAPVAPLAQELTWIKIRVVDEEGNPVSGVILDVKLPSRSTARVSTGRDGIAEIKDIERHSGTFEITAVEYKEPLELVQVT